MSTTSDDHAALAERLAVARDAARAAGAALLRHYGALDRLTIVQKGVNDFVSEADHEAEAIISRLIRDRFAEDGFLGEETGFSGAKDGRLVWCVDPLDGTTNFLKGAHNWCVSIGVWARDHAALGVLYDPLRDEMFTAIEGGGAYCNGKPMRVSAVERLDAASLGLGHNKRVEVADFAADIARLLSAGASFRQVGAGALMLAYTAAGRVDCYFERHMWPWDAVAGLALIREAGGATLPYLAGGRSLESGGLVLASGPELFAPLERALGPF
jgi:myo-inositol-1(or 4)-monophosphatase